MTGSGLKRVARAILAGLGLRPDRDRRFRGVFSSYQQAMAAVRPGKFAGFDNDANATANFEEMCKLTLRDYPVLFWLQKLAPDIKCLIDAGGHMGTKYRAFRGHLSELDGLNWVVYDVPAVIRAGRERARIDGLSALSFIDTLSAAPPADLVLASGLLQYIDISFADLLRQLPSLPAHVILNKVATREGPSIVTLESRGSAEDPYQIRNRAEFEKSLQSLGYVILDQWVIPELSHVIPYHRSLGASTSRGYYAKLSA